MGEKKIADDASVEKGREMMDEIEKSTGCKVKTDVKAGPSSGAQVPYGPVQPR